jgi:ribulose-phosphate 3-epimerase
MPNHLIAPSLLAADFKNLEEEIEMINASEADWLHLDIMDGRFVPNISYGMMIVEVANEVCRKPLDTHLMIVEPEKYVKDFIDAGSDLVSVHVEASPHLHRTVQLIKEEGAKAGVVLNPHTPVEKVYNVLEDVDLVLLMSVNPGFGGQKFIYRTLHKIKKLKKEIIDRNLDCQIEVDGGVGLHNAQKILEAGADVLVAGSAIFKTDDPTESIQRFKQIGSENL